MPNQADNTGTVRRLRNTIDGCLESGRALDPFLQRQAHSLERLGEKIDEAFAGRPLLPEDAPTSRRNLRRFSKYYRLLRALLALKTRVYAMWARAHAISPAMTDAYVEMLCLQAKAELRAGRLQGGVLGLAGPGVELCPPRTQQEWRVWKQQVKCRLAVGRRPEWP